MSAAKREKDGKTMENESNTLLGEDHFNRHAPGIEPTKTTGGQPAFF